MSFQPYECLSKEALLYLNRVLIHQSNLTIFELHGFLCAFISAPSSIPVDTILSLFLLNNNLISEIEIHTCMNTMTQLYQHINHCLQQGKPCIPLIDVESIECLKAKALTTYQRDNLSL